MNPTFYVNLGPIKLKEIIDYISAEIVGLDLNSEFNEFVGIDKVRRIDNTISFVYENHNEKIDLPKKTNLIISKREKNKFSDYENLIIVDNVHETVAKLSSVFYRDINDNDLNEHNHQQSSDECYISKTAIIKKGVIIGKNSIIKVGVFGMNS